MDFVWDRLQSGRRLKILNVIDDYTRECVAIEVDFGINGHRVIQTLERAMEERGKVVAIRSDNGPEFISNALDGWAYSNGIKLDFIRPGKPNDNAFVESFNDKFRQECLNDNQFLTLPEAQTVIEIWRRDFNEQRPHDSLDGMTPREFADQHTAMLNMKAPGIHQLALA